MSFSDTPDFGKKKYFICEWMKFNVQQWGMGTTRVNYVPPIVEYIWPLKNTLYNNFNDIENTYI